MWSDHDLDSVLTLRFDQTDRGAAVTLIHAACPDQFLEQWNTLYWEPWRAYLARRRSHVTGAGR